MKKQRYEMKYTHYILLQFLFFLAFLFQFYEEINVDLACCFFSFSFKTKASGDKGGIFGHGS